ncbi:MAG TPA: hypothetical protein DEP84_09260 [Chloroflexi bacterium]|nr:hypothetical protein [Chloroflexota bacterium]
MVFRSNYVRLNVEFETKTGVVTRLIRRKIIVGDYPIGDRIPVDRVAAELHVSQTPVREALRILEAEGYVESLPHQGFQVASPDTSNLSDIFGLLEIIDGYAARLAAKRITHENLANLEELHARMIESVKQKDDRLVRALNLEFHETIYMATEVPKLISLLNFFWATARWDILSTHPDRMPRTLQEHQAVLDALRRRDPDAASAALAAHARSCEYDSMELEKLCQAGGRGRGD